MVIKDSTVDRTARTHVHEELTSSKILRGGEDVDELALDEHSHHLLAFSIPPEIATRHDRVRTDYVDIVSAVGVRVCATAQNGLTGNGGRTDTATITT